MAAGFGAFGSGEGEVGDGVDGGCLERAAKPEVRIYRVGRPHPLGLVGQVQGQHGRLRGDIARSVGGKKRNRRLVQVGVAV